MTNPHFFSKITLKKSAPLQKLRELLHDGYAPHKTVWQLLSHNTEQKRNFLFRYDIEAQNGLPQFYVLSETDPTAEHPCWNVEVARHSYPEFLNRLQIQEGSVFRFSLRVNPTYSPPKKYRTRPNEKRRDLIMHLRYIMPKNEQGIREELHTITEHRACKEWLERRKNLGFEVVEPDKSLLIQQYDQVRFRHKGNTTILSRVDMNGMLKVTDVATFYENLTNGIGHGKAFGCGLLLIRPI